MVVFHVSTFILQLHRWVVLFLEQDTGVEPAFTAWEAVVLPIYESCIDRIIAKGFEKSNNNLSNGWIASTKDLQISV